MKDTEKVYQKYHLREKEEDNESELTKEEK